MSGERVHIDLGNSSLILKHKIDQSKPSPVKPNKNFLIFIRQNLITRFSINYDFLSLSSCVVNAVKARYPKKDDEAYVGYQEKSPIFTRKRFKKIKKS